MLKRMGSDGQPGVVPQRRVYQGSALLHSAARRLGRVLVVVALMWLIAGWAMDWW